MTLGDRSVRRIGAETLRPRPAVSGLPAGGRVEHAAILMVTGPPMAGVFGDFAHWTHPDAGAAAGWRGPADCPDAVDDASLASLTG